MALTGNRCVGRIMNIIIIQVRVILMNRELGKCLLWILESSEVSSVLGYIEC